MEYVEMAKEYTEMAVSPLIMLSSIAVLVAGASVGVDQVLGYDFIAMVADMFKPLAQFLGLGAFVGGVNELSWLLRDEPLA